MNAVRRERRSIRKMPIVISEIFRWTLFGVLLTGLILSRMSQKMSKAAFSDVSGAVTAAADLTGSTESGGQMLRRLYHIDPQQLRDFTLYAPATNMSANELLIAQTTNSADAEAILSAATERIATQKKSFAGYGIAQTEMLSHAVTESRGGYVLLYVGEDPENVKKTFASATG